MSPDPEVDKVPCGEKFTVAEGNTAEPEALGDDLKLLKDDAAPSPAEAVVPRKQRERRTKSPLNTLPLLEAFNAPLSPASSSSASQGNSSADVTFEPSIDMMVNDFDDEQTLNEEEALAAQEQQNPEDEIATLKEESEMPIEELLAKYHVMSSAPSAEPPRKRVKRAAGSKQSKAKRNSDNSDIPKADDPPTTESSVNVASDIIVIESGDEEATGVDKETVDEEMGEADRAVASATPTSNSVLDEVDEMENCIMEEKSKPHRSHLLDLYPDQNFGTALSEESSKDIPLEKLYDEEDEDDDDETDSDYVRKTIMVGSCYQATIPEGLSQYGDVLPYENEDKLIWEPSQVSEREVEEYLLMARDIKPNLLETDDEPTENGLNDETTATDNVILPKTNTATANNESDTATSETVIEPKTTAPTAISDNDPGGVVKDNEQALHLLVQCGYDFKEALRRKRLNALPLTGSMSLWSEEECTKFEEGIQKFGKDFLKIRQNQVRTRTMRELVHFYYLWKKSDRRDHNFANSDTVDHMDMYLNEGGDYSPNASNGATGTGAASGTTAGSSPALGTRKNSANNQKNFSIMMTGNTTNPVATMQLTKSPSSRKRNVPPTPTGGGVGGLLNAATSDSEASPPQNISLTTATTTPQAK